MVRAIDDRRERPYYSRLRLLRATYQSVYSVTGDLGTIYCIFFKNAAIQKFATHYKLIKF